jgi:3',5'-cyclic AMP phosphodiesterase CpdA
MMVSPLLGRVTQTSITLNLVAAEQSLDAYVAFKGKGLPKTEPWQRTDPFAIEAKSVAQVKLQPLSPGTLYQYELFARRRSEKEFQLVNRETFRTQRADDSPFAFAIISDSHITPWDEERSEVLSQISESILARRPDFFLMLGDNIQTFTSHGGPMDEPEFGPLLYLFLRNGLGDLPASVPVFTGVGNWEGENGWHPEPQRNWARQARTDYMSPPDPETYPEGGSGGQDYYGFTWGDALCLVLNVTGYTVADHSLGSPAGKPDDWTLGERQKAWLQAQLAGSKARWKFLFIHHTVGGNAGDETNSRYGRGGGRAAKVGEQALIHEWMRQYGVQALLYGHDHVFTDMVVDHIHYTCVGSAGAPWKFTEEETGYQKVWPDSGYTWVEVGPESAKISFVKPDSQNGEGEVLYTYTVSAPPE